MAIQQGNLQRIIPALFSGRGGQLMTPEQIAREREVAAALFVVPEKPITNWADGAAQLVDVFSSKMREGRANEAAQQNAASSQRIQQELFGALGRGSTPAMAPAFSPQAAMGGATASSGMPQMPSAVSPAGGARAAASGPSSSALPASFLASVDRTEGGGGYDTLFGHAQRSGPFAGVQISQMPISEVLAFADPSGSYGQWVKGQVGRVATPMGRHQIVGSTLRRAANELGLDPSTPFNAETQDLVAAHLARRRVQSASTTGGKIAALRSEWEGFKHVSNAEMAQIVADLESGAGAPAGAPEPVQVASLDPSIGMPEPVSSGPQEAMRSSSVAQALLGPPEAASQPPQQVAEALMPPQPYVAPQQATQSYQPPAPAPINPAILEALSSPYVDDQTRQIGMLLFQQEQQAQAAQAQAAAEWNALQEQRAYDFGLTQEQRGYDRYLTGDTRAYDATLLNAANAREDARLAVTDARQTGRDQRADFESDRNFGLAEQGLTPTSVREYDTYATDEMAAGRQPLGRLEYEQALRSSGAQQTTINTGTTDKFYETLDTEAAKTFGMLSETGALGRGKLAQIDRLEGLLGSAQSGGLAVLKQYAGEWGINTEGLSDIQAAQALINELVPQQRQPGSGPMSDADLALFKQSLPRLINQPGGNQTIINTMRGITQYQIAMGEIADRVADRELTPAQARTEIRNLQNPLEGFRPNGQQQNAPSRPPSAQTPLVSGTGVPSEPNGAMPMVQSQEAYDALPSGATFVAPDGQVRRKP